MYFSGFVCSKTGIFVLLSKPGNAILKQRCSVIAQVNVKLYEKICSWKKSYSDEIVYTLKAYLHDFEECVVKK